MPISKAAQQKERKLRQDDKKACMMAVLDRYVQWLNLWRSEPDDDFKYTIETFTVHNPKKELYGIARQIVHYSDGWYDIRVYEFHDGDEGGPHIVTAYFTDPLLHDVSPKSPAERIAYLFQQFDTTLTEIYKEGHWANSPEYPADRLDGLLKGE